MNAQGRRSRFRYGKRMHSDVPDGEVQRVCRLTIQLRYPFQTYPVAGPAPTFSILPPANRSDKARSMVVWLMSGHAAAMSRLPTTCLHFAKPLDMSVRMSAP